MPTLTLRQAFELAVHHHSTGKLEYARTLLSQILAAQPNHLEALKLLSQIAYQTGRPWEAAELLQRAIAVAPQSPDLHSNLGMVLAAMNREEDAIDHFRTALALRPGMPQVLNNLGNALNAVGRADEAIDAYRQAIEINPRFADALGNLGTVLATQGRFLEAVAPLRQAAALQPNSPRTWLNLGLAATDAEMFADAADAFRRVVALQPDHVQALTSLGNALWEVGEIPDAMAHLHEALRLRPDYPEALVNLANCLVDRSDRQGAMEMYRRAMKVAEGPMPAVEWNLAMLLLRDGNLEEGLNLYESRRQIPKLRCDRDFPQPMWDGSPLEGRTILLHAEQGLGDTIHFIRYVPMVIARGGRVIVQCQPPLRRLLEGQCGIELLVSEGETLPSFDVHCPLMSLPRLFGTTLQTIPADVPYLRPDSAQAERWRHMLAGEPAGLKIGLVWAGSPGNKNDWRRSIPLSMLAPLGQIPGLRYHSLQKGEAAKQALSPPDGMRITDWSEQLGDFVDTAGLIANLDLVISVDTAVAHLAGAMGKPVCVLLAHRADWRWMRERTDSPWYPTMRLFRQPRPGEWAEPIAQLVAHVGSAISDADS